MSICKNCGHEIMEKLVWVSGEVHFEHLQEIETPNELILKKRIKCFYCECIKPEPKEEEKE